MAERTIVIAVDGSGPANCAFKWYLENLRKDGDLIYLVHCPESMCNIGLPGAAADFNAITQAAKEEKDRIDIMLNGYMEQLRAIGAKCQSKLLQGSKPGEQIMKFATDEKANCIVMGSRGLGTIRRTLLGSVSEFIIHHTPPNCSVTIIRES